MKFSRLFTLFLALLFCLSACTGALPEHGESRTPSTEENTPHTPSENPNGSAEEENADADSSPAEDDKTALPPSGGETGIPSTPPTYGGKPYVTLGRASFSEELCTTASFESYAPLDSLGRCGTAFACVGRDIMPTEERGSIGQVKPTGWHTVKYEFVDGKYLYNRCHLIGFQLTGENANRQNLITGTRSFNVDGMLPFENMVADYVKETENHVLYRVTPVFIGENLVCSGVYIEAYSVEDRGEGIDFLVYCFNVEPGVVIDYATGESRLDSATDTPPSSESEKTEQRYVLNTNTKKIHLPDCRHVPTIKEHNRSEHTGALDALLKEGYTACGTCKP